ncbi:hypothetical protein ASPCADRAFT_203107 [Aspergillus carbonarius ITEM 5010]|uniref:Uncharacterized protein n=1 Tax=Aspergillus carbonarius (strain ITEM 5010) TaxID=602072 RepID=A0A1R3RY20_ASPC5|nr:hypothetical protein ASPCADRAFT_203107 [Aspergillus carbonarius ITEM 5010]
MDLPGPVIPREVDYAGPGDQLPDGDVHYMQDPALTAALQDFDQALSAYAPRPAAAESPAHSSTWPPTMDGFPILEQTWMWGLDSAPVYGEQEQEHAHEQES